MLGIPDGYEVAAVIPFGFPQKESGIDRSENLADRLHIDRWNGTTD